MANSARRLLAEREGIAHNTDKGSIGRVQEIDALLIVCPDCHGSGDCWDCEGAGSDEGYNCPECNDGSCETCDGFGKVLKEITDSEPTS